MPSFLSVPLLWAQTTQAPQTSVFDSILKVAYIVGAMALVLVLPYLLGKFLARSLRMRELGWKIGLIFITIAFAVMVMVNAWNPQTNRFKIPLGVDLKGGVILVYEIQEPEKKPGQSEKDVMETIPMGDLVTAIANRINPAGTKEIVVRPYGDRQVEIIIPEVDPIEVDHIKRLISTAGSLEFRIVANERDHAPIVELAKEQAEDADPAKRMSRKVMDGDRQVGFWAQAGKENMEASEVVGTIARNGRTGQILDLKTLTPIRSSKEKLQNWLEENGISDIEILVVTDQTPEEVVTGEDQGVVSGGVDEYMNPCVKFRLNSSGAQKFRLLTSQNLPITDTTPPLYRHLGIVLDGRLLSFPRIMSTISDSGQITGSFTQEEVDFLVGVLRAGRLPASLKKEPISENQIGSMLGDDTIIKGERSIAISLLAVLAFVAVYYRFSGIVACAALLLNLLYIMAVMVTLQAPLTLPGLAGLVLTVGMSVDANVLIFERIREEIARGAALRMAIRNGFGRATTTIVDANLTTLITAVVLYAIGTDQIRGFAVTLILGILMSMFTAIFCSRVVFDIAERKQWLKKLSMMQIVGGTTIDFIGKRRIAVACSITLIVVGLIGVVVRGENIFDIDFTGGTSVTIVLRDPMPADRVRSGLRGEFEREKKTVQFSVNTINVEGRDNDTVFKIDSDVATVDDLEKDIMDTFRDPSGNLLLQTYSMTIGQLEQIEAASKVTSAASNTNDVKKKSTKSANGSAKRTTPPAPAAKAPAPAAKPPAKTKQPAEPGTKTKATEKEKEKTNSKVDASPSSSAPKKQTSWRRDLPDDRMLAMVDMSPALLAVAQPPATDKKATVPTASKEASAAKAAPKKETPEKDAPKSEPKKSKAAGDASPAPVTPAANKAEKKDSTTSNDATPAAAPEAAQGEVRTIAHLTFGDLINAPTLLDALDNAAEATKLPLAAVVVDTDKIFDWEQNSAAANKEWYVSMVASKKDADVILKQMQKTLAATPVWPSSSLIGAKVAGDTRSLAIAALLASFLGIIGYIWIRFQHVVFGVAAVIALIHDVLLTLGAIALSVWLAKPLGFLLIEEFKISLPIVAAFLTLIGYSLNDTIVVFDRIREVRGKSPRLTKDMINLSINQTLSRTLLTSMTTLIVVAILYALGGEGIHGFAFALVVGIFVGTYSSVFIASPFLLWMLSYTKKGRDPASKTV